MTNEYIDVRGPNPVYRNGMLSVELRGLDYRTTIVQGRFISKKPDKLEDMIKFQALVYKSRVYKLNK